MTRLLRGLGVHEWLLREVLGFLEEDEDDAYRLWLAAVASRASSSGLAPLRSALGQLPLVRDAPLCMARARLLAMVHACWTALYEITETMAQTEATPQLSRYTVGLILHELGRLQRPRRLHGHPHREIAMRLAAAPGSVPSFVMYVAAQQGKLESVVYLHHVATYDPPEALDAAARGGHADVVAWLLDHAHTAKWVTPACHVVPVYQYRYDEALGVMAWHVHGTSFDGSFAMTKKWGYDWKAEASKHVYPVMDLAAKHGDMDGLDLLMASPVFSRAISSCAAENAAAEGHYLMLRQLYDHHPEVFDNGEVLRRAIQGGHLLIAGWLVYCGVDTRIESSTFDSVAKRGDLAMLKWMAEIFPDRFPPQERNVGLLNIAARAGHDHIAEWLIVEKGYTVGFDAVHDATESGKLKFAQRVLSLCTEPIDESLHCSAAKSGNMEVLRWVVEDLKLWSCMGMRFATHHRSTECAEYIYARALDRVRQFGSSMREEAVINFVSWIEEGYFETFEWLLQHGFHQDLFYNEGFFQIINHFDQWYATKYDSLGWEDEDTRNSRWPKIPHTIRRVHELMELFVDVYDETFICRTPWFPAWAVRNRKYKSLRRLADIGHPHLPTSKFARLLLRESKDEAMVQWYIEQYPSQFTTHVVRWAVEHDKRTFLVWVFETHLQSISVVSLELAHRCLRTAAWMAAKLSRDEILELLSKWTQPSDVARVWRGIEKYKPCVDVEMTDD